MGKKIVQKPPPNLPDLVLTVLQVGCFPPATLADCVRHIGDNADDNSGEGDSELSARLSETLFHLKLADLVRPSGDPGAYETTSRGRQMLRRYSPDGADSLPARYAEFSDFIAKLSQQKSSNDIKSTLQKQGYDAYMAGFSFTENPHPNDIAHYLAWENGWFKAFDDCGGIQPPPESTGANAEC